MDGIRRDLLALATPECQHFLDGYDEGLVQWDQKKETCWPAVTVNSVGQRGNLYCVEVQNQRAQKGALPHPDVQVFARVLTE